MRAFFYGLVSVCHAQVMDETMQCTCAVGGGKTCERQGHVQMHWEKCAEFGMPMRFTWHEGVE